jgi:hypothetical protein
MLLLKYGADTRLSGKGSMLGGSLHAVTRSHLLLKPDLLLSAAHPSLRVDIGGQQSAGAGAAGEGKPKQRRPQSGGISGSKKQQQKAGGSSGDKQLKPKGGVAKQKGGKQRQQQEPGGKAGKGAKPGRVGKAGGKLGKVKS